MAVSAPIRNGLIWLWGMQLAGCTPTIEDQFATYQTRVAHVLSLPSTPSPVITLVPFPAQRELQRPLPDLRIGLLDILPLNQCGLGTLVAERNGPVGRSTDNFSQLAYEWQLVQGLARCKTQDPEVAQWLTSLRQQKAAMLPDRFWNALVSTPELRRVLTPRRTPLSLTSTLLETRQALGQLQRWQEAVASPDHVTASLPPLTDALESLYRSDALPRLLYSLPLATAWLNQISAQLEPLPITTLCPATDPQRQDRLRGAMTHYYASGLQPWLAQLDRQFRQISPSLAALFDNASPPALQAWQTSYASGLESRVWLDFRAATVRHAKAWQGVFLRCEAPGGKPPLLPKSG